MTIEKCYEEIGGDFSEVIKRMATLARVKKFLNKFLEDDSFSSLCSAVREEKRADAFRAAHALKGVCQNMGFGTLQKSSFQITELLRPETEKISSDVRELLPVVEKDYLLTVQAIKKYFDEE